VDLPANQGLKFLRVVQFTALPCPHGSRVRPFDAADAVEMLGIAIEDDVDLDLIAEHESGWASFAGLKQEAEHNALRLRDAASLVRDALRARGGESGDDMSASEPEPAELARLREENAELQLAVQAASDSLADATRRLGEQANIIRRLRENAGDVTAAFIAQVEANGGAAKLRGVFSTFPLPSQYAVIAAMMDLDLLALLDAPAPEQRPADGEVTGCASE
jgi:hypothetical protein